MYDEMGGGGIRHNSGVFVMGGEQAAGVSAQFTEKKLV